jgi:hypothetical protein
VLSGYFHTNPPSYPFRYLCLKNQRKTELPVLHTELRNKLERTIVQARDVAEAGAKAALEALAVHNHEPYGHMSPEERKLRNHLRARARQLGDKQNQKGELEITHLVWECAYEHWHRMLFARFLAENDLLIEPQDKIAISLAEAEELAKESDMDVWVFASRCAQSMLPQIFRPDDPLLQVRPSIVSSFNGSSIRYRKRSLLRRMHWGGCTSFGRARGRMRSTSQRSRSARMRYRP